MVVVTVTTIRAAKVAAGVALSIVVIAIAIVMTFGLA
jgi:hypothetical protein